AAANAVAATIAALVIVKPFIFSPQAVGNYLRASLWNRCRRGDFVMFQLVTFIAGKCMAYRPNGKERRSFVSFFFTVWLTSIFGHADIGQPGMKLIAS
ncbi:hypothetical protein, partial [Caballeronia sp. J97]|uniref:hypothetical protein n=1 Tax=Caballeronia sp. J97 TaxID=2805429 RepID=UPI002AB18B36